MSVAFGAHRVALIYLSLRIFVFFGDFFCLFKSTVFPSVSRPLTKNGTCTNLIYLFDDYSDMPFISPFNNIQFKTVSSTLKKTNFINKLNVFCRVVEN